MLLFSILFGIDRTHSANNVQGHSLLNTKGGTDGYVCLRVGHILVMERGVRKPFVGRELAVKLAENLFDVQNAVVVREFDCYSDRAFHIKGSYSCSSTPQPKVSEFVLKILNSSDSKDTDFVDGENETIRFLRQHGFPCPTVFCPRANGVNDSKDLFKLPTSESAQTSDLENQNLQQYHDCVVRLMSFLPGQPLSTICSSTASLFTVGQFVGSASKALQVRSGWCISMLCIYIKKNNFIKFQIAKLIPKLLRCWRN